MDIIKARNAALKLVSKKLTPGLSNYGTYDSVYMAATSNVKGTFKLYKDYDSVLTVGATGAHAYEAALSGAKKIDQFDINELQRLYYEYMKVAIMNLSYEDFIKHFTLKKHEQLMPISAIKDLLSDKLYYRLKPYLPEDVEIVFGGLFDYIPNVNLITSSLFRFEHNLGLDYLKKFISFYNEEEYYKLQEILRKNTCEISYHTLPLSEVPYKFENKYDLIVLDNIFQYYKNIPELNSPYKVNMFVDKVLSKMLTPKGVIQTNYGFVLASEALKKHLGEKPSNDIFLNFMFKKNIEIEEKEGIDTQLIKKWDHYSYNFVDAVEYDIDNSSNVVITYSPKKK